jgi:hypothetical protein
MLSLKGPPLDGELSEAYLAQLGLNTFSQADGFIYGCYTFQPGLHYMDLARALSGQSLVGVMGLAFDETSMLPWAGLPEVRQLFGKILQAAGVTYVWSSVSKEWWPSGVVGAY